MKPHSMFSRLESSPALQALLAQSMPPLTREQEVAYFDALSPDSSCSDDDRSIIVDTLVVHNIRLVVSCALKMAHASGMMDHLEDMTQEGIFGLIKAMSKFDVSRGFKFSTYATWWIEQAIKRYLDDNSSQVRAPAYAREAARYKKKHGEHRQGTSQGAKEYADRMFNLPVAQIELSLDKQYRNSEDREQDSTPLDKELCFNPEDSLVRNLDKYSLLAELKTYLASHKASHKIGLTVLTMRYGLDGNEPKTLERIGKALGITRERARQIEEETKAIAARWLRAKYPEYVQGEPNLKGNLLRIKE